MQLKKRFTIKKQLAVGAVTAVMFVTSLPAFASDGLFEGRGSLHLGLGFDKHLDAEAQAEGEAHAKAPEQLGLISDIKTLQKDIREELKDVRKELKDARPVVSATVSAEVAVRKLCRKESETEYRTAIAKARDERDASLKASQQTYLTGLKSARDAFHARLVKAGISLGIGQLTLSASASAELKAARLDYQTALKEIQKTFKDAKKKISTTYRDETKTARQKLETERKACKN